MGKVSPQYYQRMREAKDRGYCVTEDGTLFGPKGQIELKLYGKQRYPTFSTNWGGKVFGIPVHKFAAYCFYGEESFNAECIRHLNSDTLDCSKDNLVLGTHSENNLDKDKNIRSRAAKIARASQGKTPFNAKLTTEQVGEIREAYKEVKGIKAPNGFTKKLCEKYGVSRTVICSIKRGKSYA